MSSDYSYSYINTTKPEGGWSWRLKCSFAKLLRTFLELSFSGLKSNSFWVSSFTYGVLWKHGIWVQMTRISSKREVWPEGSCPGPPAFHRALPFTRQPLFGLHHVSCESHLITFGRQPCGTVYNYKSFSHLISWTDHLYSVVLSSRTTQHKHSRLYEIL